MSDKSVTRKQKLKKEEKYFRQQCKKKDFFLEPNVFWRIQTTKVVSPIQALKAQQSIFKMLFFRTSH
jgi:hypothetical protein